MHQPESPYASFTDLLVSLVFIFLLLVAVLAINVRPPGKPESMPDKLAKLTSGLGDKLRDSGVAVQVDAPNGRLTFGADVLFPVGSADLTLEGQQAVAELAIQLRRILPPHVHNLSRTDDTPNPVEPLSIDTILVEGHADPSPFRGTGGRYKDNTELSAARARAVQLWLFETTPDLAEALSGLLTTTSQMHPLFGIAGYGESRPAKLGLPPTDPAHRRVEIRIIAFPPNNK